MRVSRAEIAATVARMEARAAAELDPSLQELWAIYRQLAARFELDLGAASRDAALAKSAALMVLQAARQRKASVLINIDVADLAAASTFYCEALGLAVGRRFGDSGIELLGATAPLYLLAKPSGSAAAPATSQRRDYARHWTPVHLDFVVPDVQAAVARAHAAGATLEGEIATHIWGRIALMADPFGHGFCLIEFRGRGYDEIAS